MFESDWELPLSKNLQWVNYGQELSGDQHVKRAASDWERSLSRYD